MRMNCRKLCKLIFTFVTVSIILILRVNQGNFNSNEKLNEAKRGDFQNGGFIPLDEQEPIVQVKHDPLQIEVSRKQRNAMSLEPSTVDESENIKEYGNEAKQIFLALKTTKPFHDTRLNLLIKTWIPLVKEQVGRKCLNCRCKLKAGL